MNSIPKEEIEFLKQKYASEEIKAQSSDIMHTAKSRIEKLFKNQAISENIKEGFIAQTIDAQERIILCNALRWKDQKVFQSYEPNSMERLTPDFFRTYYIKIPKGYIRLSMYGMLERENKGLPSPGYDCVALNQSF